VKLRFARNAFQVGHVKQCNPHFSDTHIFYLNLKFHFLHLRMSNGEDGQPHITKFEFRSKFFAYCTQAGHLLPFFPSIHQQSFSISQFMWQSIIFMQVCIIIFFTHLLYESKFIPERKNANIFQQETFCQFRKEATNQVNSCLPSF
jgi:hypothetical protein